MVRVSGGEVVGGENRLLIVYTIWFLVLLVAAKVKVTEAVEVNPSQLLTVTVPSSTVQLRLPPMGSVCAVETSCAHCSVDGKYTVILSPLFSAF